MALSIAPISPIPNGGYVLALLSWLLLIGFSAAHSPIAPAVAANQIAIVLKASSINLFTWFKAMRENCAKSAFPKLGNREFVKPWPTTN